MSKGKQDAIASENLVELAQLLKDNGYQIHGIEYGAPREQDGEVGVFYTVKVSKYLTTD